MQQILPLKKSLVKSIAKQAARVDRALNDGKLFSSVEVVAETEEQPALKVFEREEFKPCSYDKFSIFHKICQAEIE